MVYARRTGNGRSPSTDYSVPVVDETIAPDDEYRYPWYVWTFVNTVAKGVATQHPNLPTRAIAMMQKSTRTVFFKQPNLAGAAALRDSIPVRVADSSYWIAIADASTAVGCPPGWALGRLVFVVTLHAALVCPCLAWNR